MTSSLSQTSVSESDDEIEPDVSDVDDVYPPDDISNEDDDDGDASGPWVTIATFWEAPKVHLARIKLESEGIPCVIADENIIAMDWLMANAVGGIKLQVPQSRAAEAISHLGMAPPRSYSDEPLFDGQLQCPRCGSDRIDRPKINRRFAFLSILFLSFPIPLFSRKNHCQACAFTW